MIFSPLFSLCFKSILLPFLRGEHRRKRREPLPLSKLKSKQGHAECHADGLHSPQQNLHVTHFLAAQHPQKAPKNKPDNCVIKFPLTSQPWRSSKITLYQCPLDPSGYGWEAALWQGPCPDQVWCREGGLLTTLLRIVPLQGDHLNYNTLSPS